MNGNCCGLMKLTEKLKTSGKELVYLNCRTNQGMFFCHVFLLNLHFLWFFFYLELDLWSVYHQVK